jgi:hypothetical protein
MFSSMDKAVDGAAAAERARRLEPQRSPLREGPGPADQSRAKYPRGRKPADAVPAAAALVWLGLALVLAASGVVGVPPRPLVPVLIMGPVLGYLVLRRRPQVASALDSLPLWGLVAYHLVRLPYGVFFLVEHARGVLPAAFALTAGWGDILAGSLALPAAWAALSPSPAGGRRALLWAWSALALADMLLVIATAQRLLLIESDPLMQQAFARPPYAILPLFVVPMVLITQLEVMRRLRRPAAQPTTRRRSSA